MPMKLFDIRNDYSLQESTEKKLGDGWEIAPLLPLQNIAIALDKDREPVYLIIHYDEKEKT